MTPWVLRLIIANVAMFFIQDLAPYFANKLAMYPRALLVQPWTLVTYMFLHGGFSHLLFNMLSLFFFGPRVEARLGSRNFLGLYLASGIMGALLSLVFMPRVGVIGASGAVFGVTLAFARYWPRDQILIWGIFPIEARWLVAIMTVISLYSGFTPSRDGIAHFAHLGGFLGGYLFLRWIELRSPAGDFRARTSPVLHKPRVSTSSADILRWSKIPRDRMHEVNRTEVDRILDKINASGIASLTPSERETLERFSPRA